MPTTGGGKFFTVSKLLEGIVSNNGKTILIDATGEYFTHDAKDYSNVSAILSETSFFHYSNLTVGDLFVLLRPSGQVQAPKLMAAIKSLKGLKISKKHSENDDTITKNEDKNYLQQDELDVLNRMVTAYLEVAELQALNRKAMYMNDWFGRLYDFLTENLL